MSSQHFRRINSKTYSLKRFPYPDRPKFRSAAISEATAKHSIIAFSSRSTLLPLTTVQKQKHNFLANENIVLFFQQTVSLVIFPLFFLRVYLLRPNCIESILFQQKNDSRLSRDDVRVKKIVLVVYKMASCRKRRNNNESIKNISWKPFFLVLPKEKKKSTMVKGTRFDNRICTEKPRKKKWKES